MRLELARALILGTLTPQDPPQSENVALPIAVFCKVLGVGSYPYPINLHGFLCFIRNLLLSYDF